MEFSIPTKRALRVLITLFSIALIYTDAHSNESFDRDRREDSRSFHIPRALRLDEIIREAIVSYEVSLKEHQISIGALRQLLESSAHNERPTIKEDIKTEVRAHREIQKEFRKSIRRRISELRSHR